MVVLQWIRSVIFIVLMYLSMVVIGIVYLPWAIAHRNGAFAACQAYTQFVRFIAHHIVGLKSEIRGTVPTGECVIAAKHQSFFDILLIFNVTPRPKFIMKSALRFAPILGFYALRIGCVPVNRGKRAQAIAQMKEGVAKGLNDPGQLIIFPQGTRVAAGDKKPYKVGVGVLYIELGQTCVPTATNVGVFWPRHGIYRKPGVAVVEFLDPIEPGLPIESFMPALEATIEEHSNRLMAEAGLKT
jgi:1-acyl-sn-glycerol-3-phosphate acyltransferase